MISHEDYFCHLPLIKSIHKLNSTTDDKDKEIEEIKETNADQFLHPFSVSLVTSFNIESEIKPLLETQEQDLHTLLDTNRHLFATQYSELTLIPTIPYPHKIPTKDTLSIYKRPYCHSYKEQEVITTHVQELLQQGLIQPSLSP